MFAQLANLFAGLLKAFSTAAKKIVDRFDRTEAYVDTTGDGQAESSVTGRSLGLSGTALDLTGDGHADFIMPPSALTYWAQELFPAALLLAAVQLASAAVFQALLGIDFGTALYHCLVTATTVGYGDVAMSTSAARLFACLHIVVSVSWLAAVIGAIDQLRELRQAQLDRAALITDPPKREEIMALDHDGKGVDQLEFVVGMMMLLGVELCGEPLKWADVRPFMLQFERFDVSKTGRLSSDDLDKYTDAMLEQKKRIAEAAMLSPRAKKRGGVMSSAKNDAKVVPAAEAHGRSSPELSTDEVRPFGDHEP